MMNYGIAAGNRVRVIAMSPSGLIGSLPVMEFYPSDQKSYIFIVL